MIIEAYNPDYTGSDYIYKRWRDSEGNLIEETVTDFRPYFFWIKSSTSPRFVGQHYRPIPRFKGRLG